MELEFISPRPLTRIEPRQIAPKGKGEQDGPTQADVLLESIVVLARKPQTVTTKTALRSLVVKCSREIALDF